MISIDDDTIRWRWGLIHSPDGVARQLPQKHSWCQAVWITKEGLARKRYFNPMSKEWTWGEAQPVVERDGEMGYHHNASFVSVERAIAMAWKRRQPGCTRLHPEDPTSWKVGEEDVRRKVLKGETFAPLRWHIGLFLADSRFEISSFGRLRAPDGQITRGVWFDDRYWAGTPELVDLTSAAAKRLVVKLPPRIDMAADALLAGATPRSLATELDVRESTGWQYFTMAAQHLPPKELRAAMVKLIPTDLVRLLDTMANLKDKRLGGSLSELMNSATRLLPALARHPFRFEMLRFGRLCVVAG